MSQIALIGPRQAGKTTYLAALANCENKQLYPGLKVVVQGESSTKLKNMANNLILLKDRLQATPVGNEEYCAFTITIPVRRFPLKTIEVKLAVVDYAGGIFENIARQPNEDKKTVKKLFEMPYWLVMLTDWHQKQDREYQMIFQKLFDQIDREKINSQRIAVVMSKCERGELWPGRWEPDQDLFKLRLPMTYNYLTDNLSERIAFFACSSFGTLGRADPRPNHAQFDGDEPTDINAILKEPNSWKPYGLISPLYWLSTGKVLFDQSL